MNTKKSPKKQLNKFIKFSSIGLQMGVAIYLGSLLGKWLDDKFPNENQLWTKICTLLAIFIAMYSVIKQVYKISKNNDS